MDLPVRCVDLTSQQVSEAITSVAAMRALLEHMARIAGDAAGAPKILVPIAQLATTACDWVDHGLVVEITAVDGATRIAIASDLGGGARELLFPRLVLATDHDEFVRAITLAPQLVYPLNAHVEKGHIILSCATDAIGTLAPPAFEISEESLRRSLPPALRASLPPLLVNEAETGRYVPIVQESGSVLGRIVPKAPRAPSDLVEGAALTVGWEVTGAYSSTVGTRATKPPPEPRALSTAPTKPPPEPAARSTAKRKP